MIYKPTILIISCLVFFEIQAQQKNTTKNKQGDWTHYSKTNSVAAKQLAQNKTDLLLNEQDTLHLISITEDELGFKHYRYQQLYKGVQIEGAIYLMHEKEGKVTLSNGQLVEGLNMSTKPNLTENDARFLAIQFTNAKLYAWESKEHQAQLKRSNKNSNASYFPTGTLTITNSQFSLKADNYRLAYKFDIYALDPYSQNEVYVDAQNGDILLVVDNIHSCTETNINAKTNYSGNVNVSVCKEDSLASHLKSELYGGLEVRDFSSNNLSSIEDSLATEVLWATQKTFDYFNTEHNRNIVDSVTVSKINYSGDFFGAFYLSQQGEIVYCDGNETSHNAYTSPDIVGHELTHGVNKFSANLINRYESGALNESFADIFGELIEAYCLGNNDWITGAQVSPTNNGLRNLANPKDETMKTMQPNTYLGDNWIIPSSICIRNNDYCGIHSNSGVQNYWFYLLAEGGNGINDNDFSYDIAGIGKQKAAQITYRNLTTYLTPGASYKDARQGAIQSTIDLFGKSSFEENQTRKAWHAVGVTNNPIKIETINEEILTGGNIQFELLVDSLNKDMSANGLIIYLDVLNNYDIISVELINPNLGPEELIINPSNLSEILINRTSNQTINTIEPLFKITAELKSTSLTNTLTTFEIKGGTTTYNGGFIPFEDALFNVPFNNCDNENELSSWLPLLTYIKYETCIELGSATIKIIEDKAAPYAHIWTDKNDTIVYQHVGYEKEIEAPNLKAGVYNVTVNDTGGNCTSYQVKIPLLANRDGNNFCNNRCPDYLIIPDGNLQGTYNAKVELEVKGFIGKNQNASFSICN